MTPDLFTLLPIIPSIGYGIFSYGCAVRFCRRPEGTWHPPSGHLPLTIMKPVKGLDPEAYENFATFCRQDSQGFQLLFAVADDHDPAVPVIRRLIEDFPHLDIDLVVDEGSHGPNPKVSNLINAFPRAKHGIILICDSDVRVGPGFLRSMAAPFDDPRVGLVTSLYRAASVRGPASALEALGISLEMTPNVLAAERLEGLSFALGAAVAVRREALASIGGLAPLAGCLADDYQLGNRVRRAGWSLALSASVVECVLRRESWSAVLARQLRWARTIRASRPLGYLGSVMVHPFPAAVLSILLGGRHGLWGALLIYATRALLSAGLNRLRTGDGLLPGWLWLLPIRDAISFITWCLAFLGNRVTWRGRRYELLPGGGIRELL